MLWSFLGHFMCIFMSLSTYKKILEVLRCFLMFWDVLRCSHVL